MIPAARHYNFPLSFDRCRFVHYYYNSRPFSFRVRVLSYGFSVCALGVSTIWVLWPHSGCARHGLKSRGLKSRGLKSRGLKSHSLKSRAGGTNHER